MKYAPDINLFKYVVTVFDKKKKKEKGNNPFGHRSREQGSR